ncbi:MAG: hypothetical protein WAK17_15740 [Candidatus Nitrosopolaris sp.]|jgi:hypothetical protein
MNTRTNLIFSIMGILAVVLLFPSGPLPGNQAFAYPSYGGYGDYPSYGGYCSYADYKSNVITYGDCFGY